MHNPFSLLDPAAFKMPKVSVCIPTYNGARYLAECIDSIITQTFEDLEILVVDDASTDETLDIARAYAKRDTRIAIYENSTNLGLVKNWNQCITLARCTWIKFIFQDDILEPRCIEKLLCAAIDSGHPLSVCKRDFIFNKDSAALKSEFEQFQTKYTLDAIAGSRTTTLTAREVCQAVMKFKFANFIGEPSSTLIQRAVFLELGAFDSRLIQKCDLELLLRIGTNHGIAYVAETLSHFRVHVNSTTTQNLTQKKFQAEVIDELLLYKIVALSEQFSVLRTIAARENVNFGRLYNEKLVNALYGAKMLATSNAKNRDIGTNILQILLSNVATEPFTLRYRALLTERLLTGKIRRFLERNLLWRLKV